MKFAILTATENGYDKPFTKIVTDQVISTNDDGTPKRRSDFTESERQEMGFAKYTEESTTGYIPGDYVDVLDASGYSRTYPNKTPRPAPPVTREQVVAECARRLAAGFNYDFADVRGVHTIGTTDNDMDGWREVTDIANARIATDDTTLINIATETGGCQVTPLEWMDVLKAAAAFRQPIWSASFALQAQDPIPTDYANDEHWI